MLTTPGHRPALCVAIVGAESTGKTTLAQALAARLAAELEPAGTRVAWVPERLRSWCDAHGRTPMAHEQAPLLEAQHGCIDAAAERHGLVVCDTTALMTAVYSRIVFGDRSLDSRAAMLHRRAVDVTLLTALDLPWVADGLQRDGPQVQQPVDEALRELMQAHRIDRITVAGAGPERLLQARRALEPSLRARGLSGTATSTPANSAAVPDGLFSMRGRGGTGLAERIEGVQSTDPCWVCACCPPGWAAR